MRSSPIGLRLGIDQEYRRLMNCAHLRVMETDNFEIREFTVTREEAHVHNLRCLINEQPERGIEPGVYYKLLEKTNYGKLLWMSNTPAEMSDHVKPLREMRARGNDVLIFGLGIGMIASAALKSENIGRVFVVDINQELIDLVAPMLPSKRLICIHADAFAYTPRDFASQFPDAKLSVVYFDVWADLDCDNLPVYANLKRRWSKVSDWRHCWGERFLRKRAKQNARQRDLRRILGGAL